MGHSLLKKNLVSLAAMSALPLVGCVASVPAESSLTIPETTDKYGTFYQIFPYSFADSNGDGVGDIQGIIDKLDYIDSLHYDGIWLTPVHPSDTYHKYDVDDYCAIDSHFGTLTTYDTLVNECHKRGMKVLLDLVFNHTSDSNVWFNSCLYANSRTLTSDSPYYPYKNYYNVVKSTTPAEGYASANTYGYPGLTYECRFWSEMPDLNLGNVLAEPDGYLAKDLKKVMSFWLKDHNVDGFRLDAVTSYFTGNQDKNAQFLKWLHDYVVSVKPSAYIVGEGAWGSPNENLNYQTTSGCDSFFNFEDSTANGYPAQAIIHQDASYLYSGIKKNLSTVSATGIPAPFIMNHDQGRMYGACYGSQGVSNLKFAHALLQMMNGCTFVYYGDEIGMKVLPNTTADEDKRQPLIWGDDHQCKPVRASTSGTDEEKAPYGSVATQEKDDASLLNFVKKVNAARRAYPAIARGDVTSLYDSDNANLSVIKKTYNDSSVYLAVNASKTSARDWDFSKLGVSLKLGTTLSPDGTASIKGNVVSVPSQSVVILLESSK
jgi:alpha-amylase